MARYEHLPIYKKAFDTAVYFEKVVAGFSRYHKYTLGTDIRNQSREIVGLIVTANSTKEKLPRLLELRYKLEGNRSPHSSFAPKLRYFGTQRVTYVQYAHLFRAKMPCFEPKSKHGERLHSKS